MRKILTAAAVLTLLGTAGIAQTAKTATLPGPTDPKAQKTYAEAVDWMKRGQSAIALDGFKKADKQDGGHCAACHEQMITLGEKFGDYKTAEQAAQEMLQQAQTPSDTGEAHFKMGLVYLHEAMAKNKSDLYTSADKEFKSVIVADPKNATAYYADGIALAHLSQDDSAKEQFQKVVSMAANSPERMRAARYAERPELARARMAPPFAVTTIDGKQVSLDSFAGRVVLIDFWATWCGPCREALPHMQKIAKEFEGQPLTVISVSLDSDDQKWRDFVSKNNMTWMQARDGGFTGPISKLFGVNAIPHTFTIDSDGVLQDEHIGDASVEKKLRKLCDQAKRAQQAPEVASAGH